MKERPILFSAPMVRALLRAENPKTQTRRIVKPQPDERFYGPDWYYQTVTDRHGEDRPSKNEVFGIYIEDAGWTCPYDGPETKLWVRENFLTRHSGATVVYQADFDPVEAAGLGGMYGGWKPSIHMPRKFSRITLEITDVRVERLQDISEEDAKAEGVEASQSVEMIDGSPCYSLPFRILWEQINGTGSWASDPWVWAISFRRVKP